MTAAGDLAQDLRAHAHEVPEPIGKLMREAAAVLDRYKHLIIISDDAVQPPPFPPPNDDGHRRPAS